MTTNAKGLTEEYVIGRNTLIWGDNATGKTAIVNSVLSGLCKAIADEMWRSRVKDARIHLIGPQEGLRVEIAEEDSGVVVATVGGEPGKKPKFEQSRVYVDAYGEVSEALSGRSKLIDWLGPMIAEGPHKELTAKKAALKKLHENAPSALPILGADVSSELLKYDAEFRARIVTRDVNGAIEAYEAAMKLAKRYGIFQFTSKRAQEVQNYAPEIDRAKEAVAAADAALVARIEAELPRYLSLASRFLATGDRLGIDMNDGATYIQRGDLKLYPSCGMERVSIAYGLVSSLIRRPFVFTVPDIQWGERGLKDFMSRVERDDVPDRLVLIQVAGTRVPKRGPWTYIALK